MILRPAGPPEVRDAVSICVTHAGGVIEQIVTDDPELLGRWLLYTAHQLPRHEQNLTGNWHVRTARIDP